MPSRRGRNYGIGEDSPGGDYLACGSHQAWARTSLAKPRNRPIALRFACAKRCARGASRASATQPESQKLRLVTSLLAVARRPQAMDLRESLARPASPIATATSVERRL